MQKSKKFITAFLATIMVMSTAACGGNASQNSSSQQSAEVSSTTGEEKTGYDTHVELSWFKEGITGHEINYDGDAYGQFWQDKFNTTFDLTAATMDDSDWSQRLRIWINSGDMPDVAHWGFNYGELVDYAAQDAVYRFPDDWKERWPNVAASQECVPGAAVAEEKLGGTYTLFRTIFANHRPSERLAVNVDQLVMSLLTAGSECVEMRSMYEKNPWNKAIQGDGVVSWLLEQNRKHQFQVIWLKPGVWRIDDWFSSSCYLIEGQDKALLIDTGLGEGNLAELVTSLTNLPVEVAITHPHGDHMHWVDSFDRVYLHKDDIALMRGKSDVFPATFRYPNNSHTEFIPIEEGTKIHLGNIDVEVWELSGHTAHSVVFVDRSHKCIFTGDAIGSGYIVLLICSEEHAMETVEQYRESLMKITPRMSELKNFAWLGGHGIQENGCDPRHQQDYLAGESQYFNPIRQQVMLDMICLCNNLISGKISWKSVIDSPEHYCNTGSAGIFFHFI